MSSAASTCLRHLVAGMEEEERRATLRHVTSSLHAQVTSSQPSNYHKDIQGSSKNNILQKDTNPWHQAREVQKCLGLHSSPLLHQVWHPSSPHSGLHLISLLTSHHLPLHLPPQHLALARGHLELLPLLGAPPPPPALLGALARGLTRCTSHLPPPYHLLPAT